MPWTVAAKGSFSYGPGIRTPSHRAYPFRFLAAVEAASFNRRHPNPMGGRYEPIKLPRRLIHTRRPPWVDNP
jgi:hypothetical protein